MEGEYISIYVNILSNIHKIIYLIRNKIDHIFCSQFNKIFFISLRVILIFLCVPKIVYPSNDNTVFLGAVRVGLR